MKSVKDYMRKKIIMFKPNDSIFKVAKMLSKHHISGAPVVKGKKVVGIISETDIIKYMDLKMPDGEMTAEEPHLLTILILSLVKDHFDFKKELQRIAQIKVKDLMSKDIVSIEPGNNIVEAATLLEKNKIDRLPVLQKNKLVGIISRADLIRALIE